VYYFEPNQKEALIAQIKADLLPTDSIVLKGSNGMGLAEVVAKL
jgi:UDP-N-acetylmuramoyl-tripeptide--D-alanyl-D-alanine ligase